MMTEPGSDEARSLLAECLEEHADSDSLCPECVSIPIFGRMPSTGYVNVRLAKRWAEVGMSCRQIADVFGCTVEMVEKRVWGG